MRTQPQPTAAFPGTEAKILELQARVERGDEIHAAGDAKPRDGSEPDSDVSYAGVVPHVEGGRLVLPWRAEFARKKVHVAHA